MMLRSHTLELYWHTTATACQGLRERRGIADLRSHLSHCIALGLGFWGLGFGVWGQEVRTPLT